MYGMSVSRFQTVVSSTVEPFPLERSYTRTHHSKRRTTLCRKFGLAWLGLRAGRTTMMCARVQSPCKRNIGSSIATKASTFLGAP